MNVTSRDAEVIDDRLVPSARAHLPALDGLRAIAMLAVVGCHLVFPNQALHFDALDRVLVRGWIGVDLFFVLSGFLITGILIDSRGAEGYFRRFYARRALRIFPIYYLLLALLCFGGPLFQWVTGISAPSDYMVLRAHQGWFWSYLANVIQARLPNQEWFWAGHLWSLSVEEQFYLAWPAVVWFVPRQMLGAVCATGFAYAVLSRFAWAAAFKPLIGAYVLTPMRLDALAAGALVAVLARSPRGSRLLRRSHLAVGAAALLLWAPLMISYGADLQNRRLVLYGYALQAIVFAMLIVAVIATPRAWRWLEWKPLRAIGRISYGGYLYHLPVIGLCSPLGARLIALSDGGAPLSACAHVAWIGLALGLSLGVAALSYRYIERPFLAYKERMSRPGSDAVGPSEPGVLQLNM